MKKNWTLLVALFAALSAIVACGKDDETPSTGGTNQTKTQLLTANSWKTSNFAVDINGNNQIDAGESVWDSVETCLKDNFIKFAAGGSFTADEGASICAGGTQTETGTWKFYNNENAVITQITGGDPDTVNVLALNATTLRAGATEGGMKIIFEYTKK